MSGGDGGGGGSGGDLAKVASRLEGDRGKIRLIKVTNHKYNRIINVPFKRGESWGKLVLAVRRGDCRLGDWIAIAVGSNGERDSYIYLMRKGDREARDYACRSLRLVAEARRLLARPTPLFEVVYANVTSAFSDYFRRSLDGSGLALERLRGVVEELRGEYGGLVDVAIVAWYMTHGAVYRQCIMRRFGFDCVEVEGGVEVPLIFIIDDALVMHARLPTYMEPTRCLLEMCNIEDEPVR
ncbi:MAG: hypothetical protein RXN91_08200 [Caldivirga sp.]